MRARRIMPNLRVADIEAAKGFYTDFNGKFIGNNTLVVGVKYTYSF